MVERRARRLVRVSKLLLACAFLAYAVALVLPALTVEQGFGGTRFEKTVTGIDTLRAGARGLLRILAGRMHPSAMHLALGALNLIPLTALVLWKLKGRRFVHTIPLVAVVAGFAAWSLSPASAEEVAAASEVWVILPGYYVWLWSLAGMSLALGLQWKGRAMLEAIWSQRPTAKTSGWSLDADTLIHLPLAVRSLCYGAQTLRQSLEHDPFDEDATRGGWEWHQAALELSDVDRATIQDNCVALEPAELAMQRFWDAEPDASLGPLAEMDAALDHFLATATAPPKCSAFR